MPAYSVPIANVLNGTAAAGWEKKPKTRFTAPDTSVLVADDNMVNLKVVQGLLEPYRMCEIFLEKGMDDFLPKPIDSAKLEAMLRKWIPDEKQHKEA
ncbi:MAG: hypothetical protein LBG12_02800 [Synergistaceae bacterium]|jgi:CheY-like chemotaxis protein|nr:hypothetical protein [Synergistaceae bacterium]